MLFQVRGRCESLVAYIALEGLFASVDFIMPLKVRDLLTVNREKCGVPA